MNPPPKDDVLERAVIGAFLFDCGKAMSLLSSAKLTEEHFVVSTHRLIYRAALDLFNAGMIVDVVTVGHNLAGRVEHDYLLESMESCPTVARVPQYVEKLHDLYLRRQIIAAGKEMAERAGDLEEDGEALRSLMELRLASMTAKVYRQRTAAEILDNQIGRWELARQNRCVGLETGFRCIDVYLGGLMDSSFIIISGPPASCKTTLIRNVVENIAMRGVRTSILSLEQTAEQILGACAAMVAMQSVFYLNCGNVKYSSVEEVRKAKSTVEEWPLIVEDRPHTLSECCSWIRREVGKGSRAIIIDYLQRIIPDKHMAKETDEAKVRESSTTLANMAKETGIPIVAVSSLSRSGLVRGSSQIEYDAYSMLRIGKAEHPTDRNRQWRADNLIYAVNIDKQRFGPPCETQYLRLNGNGGRLEDMLERDN